MKLVFDNLINSIKRPKDEKARNKFYVFLICFAISVVIWFLIVLSEEYYATLDYPLVYQNVPEKLVMKNKPDSVLSLRVSAGGFDLALLKYLTRRRPIEVDLSYLRLEKGNNSHYVATIETSSVAKQQIKRLHLSKTAVSIYPQELYFDFEALQTKKVKVIPEVDLNFEKQFYLSDSLKIIPDSIELIGVSEQLDQINSVRTENKIIQGIKAAREVELSIDKSELPSGIKAIPESVLLSLAVDKFTEESISLPISVAEHHEMKIKTFPAQVEITYLVALRDYNRVDKGMFTASVSYDDIMEDQRKLKVDISRRPSFIKILKTIPAEVEFLVLAK